jgi:hypothetical protein
MKKEVDAAVELQKKENQDKLESFSEEMRVERLKLTKEKEMLRAERLEQASLAEKIAQSQINAQSQREAHTFDLNKRNATKLKELYQELGEVRAALTEAESETERVREEARNTVERERRKGREEAVLRAEMLSALQHEAAEHSQAQALLISTLERDREEVEALEGLQAELSRLRTKNEFLVQENSDHRTNLRKEIVTSDFRSGELAVAKVQIKSLEKEKESRKIEKDKTTRILLQYRMEKNHVMEALLELTSELDKAHSTQQELYRQALHEKSLQELQHKHTLNILKKRSVDKKIIDELQDTVFLMSANSDESLKDDFEVNSSFTDDADYTDAISVSYSQPSTPKTHGTVPKSTITTARKRRQAASFKLRSSKDESSQRDSNSLVSNKAVADNREKQREVEPYTNFITSFFS